MENLTLKINQNSISFEFTNQLSNSLLYSLLFSPDYKVNIEFEIERIKKDIEIVEGLIKLDKDFNKTIEIIRSSINPEVGIKNLVENFNVSEIQAKTFIDIELSNFNKLDFNKILLNLQKGLDFYTDLINK